MGWVSDVVGPEVGDRVGDIVKGGGVGTLFLVGISVPLYVTYL